MVFVFFSDFPSRSVLAKALHACRGFCPSLKHRQENGWKDYWIFSKFYNCIFAYILRKNRKCDLLGQIRDSLIRGRNSLGIWFCMRAKDRSFQCFKFHGRHSRPKRENLSRLGNRRIRKFLKCLRIGRGCLRRSLWGNRAPKKQAIFLLFFKSVKWAIRCLVQGDLFFFQFRTFCPAKALKWFNPLLLLFWFVGPRFLNLLKSFLFYNLYINNLQCLLYKLICLGFFRGFNKEK